MILKLFLKKKPMVITKLNGCPTLFFINVMGFDFEKKIQFGL